MPQFTAQIQIPLICKRRQNISWKRVSTVYQLTATAWRNSAKLKKTDTVCSTIISYCQDEWPKKSNVPLEIKPYWQARGQLTVHNNLLLYGQRIVIPVSLQKEILSKSHEGHQGIQKCRLRANTSVWWPGISKHIKDLVEQCPTCVKEHTPGKEPLIPTDLPDYPWQKIGSDLFFMNGANYLVVVDYFSRYFETIKLKSITSGSIIEGLKSIFPDMASQKLSSVIMDHSTPHVSLPNSPCHINFNTSHLALCFLRAMDKQSALFKLPKDCLKMLKTHTWLF